MGDNGPRLFHGLVAGIWLAILVIIIGAVALLALEFLEWLAGVMRGNG